MVNVNNYQGQQAAVSPWDVLEGGGGAPTLKFGGKDQYGRNLPPEIGLSHTGILAEDLAASQITDYETGEPETWPDGRPKMQIVAVLETTNRDSEDDDGKRRLFIKGQMLQALQQTIRDAGGVRIGIGTRITVTLVDLKPSKNPAYSPQNIYKVELGPEIVPWVPEDQRQVDTALGVQQAQAAGFPTQEQLNAQLAQGAQQAPAQAVQQAPAQALVSQSDVDAIRQIVAAGLPLDTAVSAYATRAGKGPDFVTALIQAAGAQ